MVRDLLMICSDAGVTFILELPGILHFSGAAPEALLVNVTVGSQLPFIESKTSARGVILISFIRKHIGNRYISLSGKKQIKERSICKVSKDCQRTGRASVK
jgi:hypothetical protein